MDPVSAIATGVAALANAAGLIGAGKRQARDRWGKVYDPRDSNYDNPTGTILVVGGVVLLIVIIWAITRKK